MKNSVLVVCLTLLGVSARAAAPAVPALPAPAAFLNNHAPVPNVGAQAAIHGHDAAGYASNAAARAALNDFRSRLAQAGITVLGGTVAPGADGKFGFHVDYLDSRERAGNPGREIESYDSPEFAALPEARTEQNRSVAALSAAGFAVLRAQPGGQAGKHTYAIDYIRAPQAARPVVARPNFYFFTSPVYPIGMRWIAARDMNVTLINLQARGYRIMSYNLYQVPGTFFVQYHIRYFGR
ncbi:MAG: hypothetical protein HYZ75_01370 [Elusimicrobia bacterium]|nr:hypothetical protein [Elusimicrobiota bacterium]